ncbi:MAG: HAMP domain-containing sensor histidine kinase [Thiohalocapsa sp.]|uniref:sensor histidine kinase n=1 Tax=Thiohalocapsa sp. TaxID=2497641 RepID=UPI0025EB302C|nr:HAMP domain-containing sensor histidine kinase [Thiohalocapsa sp.]
MPKRVAGWPLTRPREVLASFTFRLALLYAVLLAGSVVILLGFIYWSTAGYMARQTDATIEAEIQGLAEQYRRRGLSGLTTLLAQRSAKRPTGAGVYLLADSKYRPLVGNIDAWPDVEPDRDGWIDFRLRDAADAGAALGEEHAARGKVFRLRGGLRLLVGRDVRELASIRGLIRDALGWGLAMTVALALAGGWLMSAGVVRRIEAVNQVGREIMEGDLSRRIPTDGSSDEFDQLAVNLNRMLGRIEALMASVRQVSDNIAHDLRTPLSRLHTKLSQLRDMDLGPDAAKGVDEAINDAEELLSAFNALLRIARVESGSRRAAFADLDPVVLVHDVAELYEPLAADKGQHLDVAPTASDSAAVLHLHGDRDLLFQALANLLDNAIKYTPPGGHIQLRAEAAVGGGVQLSVADSGPGIPAELRGKVLQRFYRIDASRSEPGHGLGLSLVQAVAHLHGAQLLLTDAAPGLRVTLVLPAAPTPPGQKPHQEA